MTTLLDSDFATAVRGELLSLGTKQSWLQRSQRHTRLALAAVLAIGLAAATTGAAVIAGGFPGSTTTTPVGGLVSVTATGSKTIELGTRVPGANAIIVDVTCISRTGTMSVPDTSGFYQDALGKSGPTVGFTSWDCAKRHTTVHITDGYLARNSTTIKITADAGTTWRAVARYATATTSDWGINASGQTFGAPNAKHGFPDLQGAQATNGKVGFVFTKQFLGFRGTGCINVYQSDGKTVIGQFSIGVTSCPSPTSGP